jgi:hypothetical protein
LANSFGVRGNLSAAQFVVLHSKAEGTTNIMKTSSRLCNACGMDNPSQAAFCMACGGPMEAGMPIPSNATGLIRQDQLLKHRYRILTQIGRGGFAAVYKAEDSHFYQAQLPLRR